MVTLSNFYKSDKWVKFRNIVIQTRTKPDGFIYDEITGKPIVNRYDVILHHTIILTNENVNDSEISLNEDHIQIVSHATHNLIHERFGYEGTKHIYLVYGAPGAGKMDYVKSIAGKNDLVLNIDNIYECITVNQRYTNNKRISKNVFKIRDTIMDMIKTNTGRFDNAYIIGGYPFIRERNELENILGAEEIFINKTYEECLINIKDRPKEHEKYLKEWFENYST